MWQVSSYSVTVCHSLSSHHCFMKSWQSCRDKMLVSTSLRFSAHSFPSHPQPAMVPWSLVSNCLLVHSGMQIGFIAFLNSTGSLSSSTAENKEIVGTRTSFFNKSWCNYYLNCSYTQIYLWMPDNVYDDSWLFAFFSIPNPHCPRQSPYLASPEWQKCIQLHYTLLLFSPHLNCSKFGPCLQVFNFDIGSLMTTQ